MISVMGATGHVGGEIVNRLRAAGENVRALGRSMGKLELLGRAGAETLAGDAADAVFLARAFAGAEAVFTLLPPDPQSAAYRAQQDRCGEAIVQALRETSVRHVVFLSSVGADLPSGTGPIAGLHAQEERLRQLTGVNVLLLRPGYFFENFHEMLPVIKHRGIAAHSVAPHVALPMIATRDIAAVAAESLRKRDWSGALVRELLGPRDLTHPEAVRIVGERLGLPDLPYVQLPYEEMAAALTQAGLTPDVASQYVEMTRGFNEGRVKSFEGRNARNTTPTRLEDFAGELAQAYRAM